MYINLSAFQCPRWPIRVTASLPTSMVSFRTSTFRWVNVYMTWGSCEIPHSTLISTESALVDFCLIIGECDILLHCDWAIQCEVVVYYLLFFLLHIINNYAVFSAVLTLLFTVFWFVTTRPDLRDALNTALRASSLRGDDIHLINPCLGVDYKNNQASVYGYDIQSHFDSCDMGLGRWHWFSHVLLKTILILTLTLSFAAWQLSNSFCFCSTRNPNPSPAYIPPLWHSTGTTTTTNAALSLTYKIQFQRKRKFLNYSACHAFSCIKGKDCSLWRS